MTSKVEGDATDASMVRNENSEEVGETNANDNATYA